LYLRFRYSRLLFFAALPLAAIYWRKTMSEYIAIFYSGPNSQMFFDLLIFSIAFACGLPLVQWGLNKEQEERKKPAVLKGKYKIIK
jgi:hypothetical protein